MWRLIRAAERARTSSRSSEAFTSSPISARVARTSVETVEEASAMVMSVLDNLASGVMRCFYYSRRSGRVDFGTGCSHPIFLRIVIKPNGFWNGCFEPLRFLRVYKDEK